jgi:hypothetical protein
MPFEWYEQHKGLPESKVRVVLADDSSSDISEFTTGDWGCTDASPLEYVETADNNEHGGKRESRRKGKTSLDRMLVPTAQEVTRSPRSRAVWRMMSTGCLFR